MESDASDASDANLFNTNQKTRIWLFCKIYWRTIFLVTTPFIFLPIAFIGKNNAYKSFYIYILTVLFWLFDVMHPAVTAMLPLVLCTILSQNKEFLYHIHFLNGILDSTFIMAAMAAIEQSKINKRISIKILLIFGCSHYRLSFLLFFTTMFLSMWMQNVMACGLMMQVVKSILIELEMLGILEIYQTIGKAKQKSNRHEQSIPRPSDFTIFYFLGVAYSSSIGAVGTLTGSQSNQIFKLISESIFPQGPRIEYPHFMLLNLPGVLLMEVLLYLWMNSYFLGMFRAQSEIALQVGITDEEAQFINELLKKQYDKIGPITFHEGVVGGVLVLTVLLQVTLHHMEMDTVYSQTSHVISAAPCFIGVILLFILPTNLACLKFFKKNTDNEPLPTAPTKACLNWTTVKNYMHLNVLFIAAGSCLIVEALKISTMTEEFEKFLLIFKNVPRALLVLIIIVFCKIISETGNSGCVVFVLLPHIAKVGIASRFANPQNLMMGAALSCSMPFHMVTGTPVNALVASYFHIPHWKMLKVGFGPSIITVTVIWCIIFLWSKVIWTDVHLHYYWKHNNTLRF